MSATFEKDTKNDMNGPLQLFDLSIVHDNFISSLIDEDDLYIRSYLNAYKELQRFCHLMGSVFGFVGSEIGGKMEILEQLVNKDNHFQTMKEMVNYEMENGLLQHRSYISGSRTLLRLHRGLDFLHNFLKRVKELEPQDKTSTIGQEVYNQTLAKYHSWFIRQGAILAMYVLPTREVMLQKVCGDRAEAALEVLPDMLEATHTVYNRTELFFKEKGLLDLP